MIDDFCNLSMKELYTTNYGVGSSTANTNKQIAIAINYTCKRLLIVVINSSKISITFLTFKQFDLSRDYQVTT